MKFTVHSGLHLTELRPGTSLIVDGRLCDVIRITPDGAVLVEDVVSENQRWIDYFIAEVIDPHQHPEALLRALGALDDEEFVA